MKKPIFSETLGPTLDHGRPRVKDSGRFVFFYYRLYIFTNTVLEFLFICSPEFVGLPPPGPNDIAQSLPKPNPSDKTG